MQKNGGFEIKLTDVQQKLFQSRRAGSKRSDVILPILDCNTYYDRQVSRSKLWFRPE